MPTPPSEPPYSEPNHELLEYKGCKVAAVLFDGVPFFHLGDICDAARWGSQICRSLENANLPEHGKRVMEEEVNGEVRSVLFLSPVAVWLVTAFIDPYGSQNLARWAKKEAERLCPQPREGDPAMFLTLMPNGTLPPRPAKFSGRLSEWYILDDAGAPRQSRNDAWAAIMVGREARQKADAIRAAAEGWA